TEVGAAGAAGEEAARRNEQGGGAGDAPALHAGRARLAAVRGADEFPLLVDPQPDGAAALPDMEVSRSESRRLLCRGGAPAHAAVASDTDAAVRARIEDEGPLWRGDQVLRCRPHQPGGDVAPALSAVQGAIDAARAVGEPGHERVVAGDLVGGDGRLQ